jgi:hypothetical protein
MMSQVTIFFFFGFVRFVIMLEHIKYTGPGKPVPSPVGGAGVDVELGVTCFSFTAQDLTTFVVGVDGGGLLLCSTTAAKPAPGYLSSIDLQYSQEYDFNSHLSFSRKKCVSYIPKHMVVTKY